MGEYAPVARPLRGRRIAIGTAALTVAVLGAWLCRAWLRTLTFDDAYMFYRYALNIRHGLGISWNPDGVPTYGMTSLPWVLVVLPLTVLPITAGHALQLASWLVGTLALIAMTACVAREAKSELLRMPAVAFAAVSLPLVANPVFAFHFSTGMDTVLSMLANTTVIFGLLRYVERPAVGRALVAGALGFAAVLTRPDNGVCALGAPFLAWLLMPGRRRWEDLTGLCLLPAALIGAELLVCKWYFQIPLPLGFYAKSLHSYAGFQNGENAVQYAYMAGSCVVPFVGVLCATLRRKQAPMVVALLLPVAITAAYLLTVRQVMGFGGRYYVPFIPYVVVPALLSVDAALADGAARPVRRMGLGIAVAIAVFLALRPVELGWEREYHAWVIPQPIPYPALPIAASEPLPYYNWIKEPGISQVAAQLPPGAVMAASEVGYVACISPRITVIDLVGLNDTRIGVHGFSMDDLLARAPDLIWLPQEHYTGLLAAMFTDPRLFQQYVVIANIFNFGIAIRRDSPLRGDIERNVRAAWRGLYPSRSLADFTVPDHYIPGSPVARDASLPGNDQF
jgi:hypothetical protein